MNGSECQSELKARMSSTFFSIMSDALEEHDGKISRGGRNITNMQFADDFDALAEEEQDSAGSPSRESRQNLHKDKMEICAKKTNLMTNSNNGIQREIKVKGQKLDSVTSFKYLGANVSDDDFKPEMVHFFY